WFVDPDRAGAWRWWSLRRQRHSVTSFPRYERGLTRRRAAGGVARIWDGRFASEHQLILLVARRTAFSQPGIACLFRCGDAAWDRATPSGWNLALFPARGSPGAVLR